MYHTPLFFFFIVFLFRGFRSLNSSISFKNSAKNEYFDLKKGYQIFHCDDNICDLCHILDLIYYSF